MTALKLTSREQYLEFCNNNPGFLSLCEIAEREYDNYLNAASLIGDKVESLGYDRPTFGEVESLMSRVQEYKR